MSGFWGTRRVRAVLTGGGAVVVAAGVASAVMLGGAANASGGEPVDSSIRQLSDGSWIAEDTVPTPPFQDEGVTGPSPMIVEGSGTDPDADILPAGPSSMIVEGSDVDPDSDMIVAPEQGLL